MEIKVFELEDFIEFLLDFELKGKDSRLRTRFVSLLMRRLDLSRQEHADLLIEFAQKDDSGEPITVKQEDGQIAYKIEDMEEYKKQYFLLMNEDFYIEEDREKEEMLKFVKDLVLNTDKTFKGEKALEYDRWCEIVETIKYNVD